MTEALKTVRLGDFKQVYMYPCVRDSLMVGIGGGFGVGGVRALLGGEFSPSIFLFQMIRPSILFDRRGEMEDSKDKD